MATDISKEIDQLKNAVYGEEVRGAFISCMEKIHEENESYDNIKAEVSQAASIVKQQVENINTKANEAQEASQKLSTAISNSKVQQTAIEGATKNSKAQQTAIEGATENSKAQQTAIEGATENSKAQQTAIEGATENSKAQQTAIEGATESSKIQQAALQKTVDSAEAVDSDIQASISAANNAANAASEAAGEVGEFLSSAKKTVNNAAETAKRLETAADGVNEAIENAETATKAAGLAADRANKASQIIEQMGTLVSNVERTDTGLKVTLTDGNIEEFAVAGSGGLNFDTGYQDENGYIHLTKDGKDIEGFDPFVVAGGGGGGATGSKITFACYTPMSFSVLETSEETVVEFKFESIDIETKTPTGSGTLAVIVNGTQRMNVNIEQGDHKQIDIRQYLTRGANTIQLVMTDSYGTTAKRNFSVTMESFVVEWSLADAVKNTESVFSFYITPTGSGVKKIYTYVDDNLYSTDNVSTTGRRLTKTIVGLSHGAHMIEVYGELTLNGIVLESNHLTSAVAQIESGNTKPVIAVNWPKGNLEQYTNIVIPYVVVDLQNNPTNVEYYVNDSQVNASSIDQSLQTWSYRPSEAGNCKLGIKTGSVVSEKTYQVGSIGDNVEEITNGLDVKVDPAKITSLRDWEYGEYSFKLSDDFDEVNGGLQLDESGIHCIRITAGDRLTLNYPIFAGDARKTGKEVKIVYKVKDSSNKEAVAISCTDGTIGLVAKANNVYLSGDQTTIKMSVCEDEKTELDINIQQDSEDKLMYMWEKCSTFVYNQYASSENFTQKASITFGSDDADVILYLFRAYSRDLTDNEIRANYICDGADGAEILARQNRNDIYDSSGKINIEVAAAKNPNVHFITVNAERMTIGKKDKVPGTISHMCVAGGNEHNFTANMVMKVQGTSSVEHAETAGGNLTIEMDEGITLADGTHKDGYAMHGEDKSIPIKILNFKKNIASEDHIVNMMCAEWYNNYQPTIRQERIDDPRVRDCLEAVMCAVFFHNTGDGPVKVGPDTVQPDETIFFGLGNLCTSKDAENAFQYEPIVIEVLNNTEPQVRFKSDDLSGDKFSNNFDFRYLDTEQYTEEQAKALWQKVQTFVYSCDYTQATNETLSNTVNINGQAFTVDSPEYRKAKWKAEVSNYFDMPGLYWHHNDTLFHLLRDNRAKNMFWSYRPDTGKWSLKFNWDNDTGHCRNNEGYIDIEPGYMDYDTIGTADVFNAADNVIFQNLRECNFAELQAAYIDRESAGAWDINKLYTYAKTNQDYICESLWIEDAQHNAIRTMQNLGTTAYLERATGKLQLHLKKSLTFQKALVDSYYCATASTGDSASFRGYTPNEWSGVQPNGLISITPYTDMFINILAGSTAYRERAYAGKTIEIDLSAALNDTEIYIRNASWIMSIGNLAGLYLGQFEASKLTRVKELLIGSDVAGYNNTNFTTATFENCKKLEMVNLGGLPSATKAFDFSKNVYLKEIYTKGSGITGLRFAKKGRLQKAYLNAVASLYMNGLYRLNTLSFENYEKLTSLTIENCNTIDSYEITRKAVNLTLIRLLGIDWNVPASAYDVLVRLHNLQGLNDDGYNTSTGVLTGSVLFSKITETKYNAIKKLISDIAFTYSEYAEERTVTFKNVNGDILYTAKTEQGGAIQDPVTSGVIEKPTKESTVENDFEFIGWDTSLDLIVQDTVITAVYKDVPRVYKVNYINDDEIIETHTVNPHDSCTYDGNDLFKKGYIWMGWDADANNVISDMNINAVYDTPVLPPAVQDLSNFDYAYSDDPLDNSAYTFQQLYAIIKTGQARKYLPQKSAKVKIVLYTTQVANDTALVFNVHSYGHYELADRSGMSNVDFYMDGVMITAYSMNPSNTNVGGWNGCARRQWLNEKLYPKAFPIKWRQLIAKSITLASAGGQSAEIIRSEDYLRIPSRAEIGFNAKDIPYKNEVSENASEITFAQYTDSNSRIKKTFNGEGSAVFWWLRSAYASSVTSFANVYYNGLSYGTNASDGYYLCVGFSA